MNAPVRLWECGRCGELHEDEDEAVDCCRPTVNEVWECGVCQETYSDREEALRCCLTAEEAAKVEEEGTRQFPPPYRDQQRYIDEFMALNHLVGAPKPEGLE